MNTENMINITDADLTELVKAAYNLSSPVGMGFLHYQEGELSDDEANALIDNDSNIPVSLDYVKGRACKLSVFADEGNLYIRDNWFDHSESQLDLLLSSIGIEKW